MTEFNTAQDTARPADGTDPAPGLIPCPHCADAVIDLDAHYQSCRSMPRDSADVAQEEAEREARLAGARQLLAEEEQRRMKACLADIEAALDRHSMTLDIEPARAVLRPKA